jgi:hypothetical protein
MDSISYRCDSTDAEKLRMPARRHGAATPDGGSSSEPGPYGAGSAPAKPKNETAFMHSTTLLTLLDIKQFLIQDHEFRTMYSGPWQVHAGGRTSPARLAASRRAEARGNSPLFQQRSLKAAEPLPWISCLALHAALLHTSAHLHSARTDAIAPE